jgi:hypothetical protein
MVQMTLGPEHVSLAIRAAVELDELRRSIPVVLGALPRLSVALREVRLDPPARQLMERVLRSLSLPVEGTPQEHLAHVAQTLEASSTLSEEQLSRMRDFCVALARALMDRSRRRQFGRVR